MCLAQERLTKVRPLDNTKNLLGKLIELHKGTYDSQIEKKKILNHSFIKLLNERRRISKPTTQRINGNPKCPICNQKIDREPSSNKVHPKGIFLVNPMVIYGRSLQISKDLFIIKLDKLFYEFELHRQINLEPKEKNIYLIVGKQRERKRKKPNQNLS